MLNLPVELLLFAVVYNTAKLRLTLVRVLAHVDQRKDLIMAIERTAHPYIVRDSTIYGGEPIVEGTRTGVRHIILLFQSGQDPEEIAVGQHLSLAQVYDAISYFYDHEEEIKHYIRNESWGNV